MAVPIDSIQVGRVFEFPGGARRVVKLSPPLGTGFNVEWEYADGQKRQGKHGGSQWVHYFRRSAKRELVVDGPGGQTRALRTSEVVPVLDAPIDVSILYSALFLSGARLNGMSANREPLIRSALNKVMFGSCIFGMASVLSVFTLKFWR